MYNTTTNLSDGLSSGKLEADLVVLGAVTVVDHQIVGAGEVLHRSTTQPEHGHIVSTTRTWSHCQHK